MRELVNVMGGSLLVSRLPSRDMSKDSGMNHSSFSNGDLNRVIFYSSLKDGELEITGFERLKRLVGSQESLTLLNENHFKILWNNQSMIPESWKSLANGGTRYVFFDGDIKDHNGALCTLCMYWMNGFLWRSNAKWSYFYYPLKLNRRVDAVSAVLPVEKL